MPDGERPDGEDAKGVAVYWHPDVLMLRHPECVGVVDRWRTGARREVSAADWYTLTHWEIEAVLELSAAHARAERRRIDEYADRIGQGHSRQGTG